MFDIKKYENKKNKIKDYNDKLDLLESLYNDVLKMITKEQEECDHELILCYSKDFASNSNAKRAKCLICDCYFELNEKFDLFSESEISSEKIIDVTDILSYELQNTIKCNENITVLKAKEELQELIEKKEYNLSYIRNQIFNALIRYDKERKKDVKKLNKKI